MNKLLVILKTSAIIIFSVGMIVLIYFHIEIISMIWKESYKVYCESPSQIQGVLVGRFVILIPAVIGVIGWFMTDNAIRRRVTVK